MGVVLGVVGLTEATANALVLRWGCYALVGQLLYTGFSSVGASGDAYNKANDLCILNSSLRIEQQVVVKATEAAVLTKVMLEQLKTTVSSWQEHIHKMQESVVSYRQQYITHYTFFLVMLAFVTVLCFYALEQKGARLERLYDKINKIKAYTGE